MKNRIYFDNAATTQVDEKVFEAMAPYLKGLFGNPSSTHAHGREVKAVIETARKNIASRLNVTPGEIFFTSGGTEADNTILNMAIKSFGIKTAITSPIEHHAVLHTLEHISKRDNLDLHLLEVDEKGRLDYDQLKDLLANNPHSLVSFMHANNEIATVNDIDRIGELCKEYNAYFHSDTVQGIGHFTYDLKKINIHSVVCSAHKIHGPKGVGFIYQKSDKRVKPWIIGGGQERGMRGGTENVAGIAGLEKAFTMAYDNLVEDRKHIQLLKSKMIQGLKSNFEGIQFNGDSESETSLFTVLNVSFPPSDSGDMLLFNLDMAGISASGGSACSSGSNVGSHVLTALGVDSSHPAVRFSFSKNNTSDEVDSCIKVLKQILG